MYQFVNVRNRIHINNISGKDTYRETASSFLLSEEFLKLYGTESTNKLYIESLYENILERSPDTAGYNYWINQIEKGYEDRSELLMGFSESLENKSIFF